MLLQTSEPSLTLSKLRFTNQIPDNKGPTSTKRDAIGIPLSSSNEAKLIIWQWKCNKLKTAAQRISEKLFEYINPILEKKLISFLYSQNESQLFRFI